MLHCRLTDWLPVWKRRPTDLQPQVEALGASDRVAALHAGRVGARCGHDVEEERRQGDPSCEYYGNALVVVVPAATMSCYVMSQMPAPSARHRTDPKGNQPITGVVTWYQIFF